MVHYDVFISYSRRDSDFVRQLFGELMIAKRQAWVDWQGIDYSTRWWEEICSGIERADNFVFVLSPDSLNSIYCHREVAHARQQGKRIICLRCRPIDEADLVGGWYVDAEMRPVEQMARENLEVLKSIQWIDYADKLKQDIPATAKALVQTIDTDPECVQAHTQLLLQAQAWQSSGRSPGALLGGDVLTEAEQRLVSCAEQVRFVAEQRDFVAASRAAQEAAAALAAQQAARTVSLRRQSRRFGAAAVLLALVTIAALFSVTQARQQVDSAAATQVALLATATTVSGYVVDAENRVESLRLAALGAAELAAGDPITATLLEIRALSLHYAPQTDLWLGQALADNHALHILSGHTNRVLAASYSADGTRIVSGSRSGELYVWDALTGVRLMQLREAGEMITSVRYSPDGQVIAAAVRDTGVILYDAQTGETLNELDPDTDQWVTVSFSPDSSLLITGEADLIMDRLPRSFVWDVQTGERIRTLDGAGAIFSPDGRTIASRSNGLVSLWTTEGDLSFALGTDASSYSDIAFSADGAFLLTWSAAARQIQVWETASGFLYRTLGDPAQSNNSAAFSPDGRWVVTSDLDSTSAIIWDVATGEVVRTLRGHQVFIEDAQFSPDGRSVVTAGGDGNVIIWDVDVSRSPRSVPALVNGSAFSLSPDGQQVVIGSSSGEMQILDVGTGALLRTLEGHTTQVTTVSYTRDGSVIASADASGLVRLWDARSGTKLAEIQVGDEYVSQVVFSDTGDQFITANYAGDLVLWDAGSGSRIRRYQGELSLISDFAVSPDGRMLALVGDSRDVYRWDVETGEALSELRGHEVDYLATVDFSPDGRYLLTGSGDPEGSVIVWNVADGTVLRRIAAPRDFISTAIFSPDSRTIAAIVSDIIIAGNFMTEERGALIWDVETGQVVRSLMTDATPMAIAYSDDGGSLYVLNQNGALREWDVDYRAFITYACTRYLRDFTDDERRLFDLTLPDGTLDMSSTCP